MKNIILKFLIKLKYLLLNTFSRKDVPFDISDQHKTRFENISSFFHIEDFKNASVLDIGFDQGTMSFQALKWGAREVLGVEYDKEKVQKGYDSIKNLCIADRITFICDDIEHYAFWNNVKPRDVTLLLPVIDTNNTKTKYSTIAHLASKTKNAMYVEGCSGHSYREYFDDLLAFTDFTCIEFKGETGTHQDGFRRPFFRCSRETLTQRGAALKIRDFIKNGTFKKIAVVGKASSGKSYTRKILQEIVDFEHDYVFADDKSDYEYVNSLDKIVFSCYTALRYVDNIEAVFFINIEEHLRRNLLFRSRWGQFIMKKWFGFRIIDEKHYLSRSPAGNMNNLKAVYTIER